ncbi:MAG: 3-hydroxybutyryl-CoA dehydrogenase [Chlorobi bacterium]|nr:MAG: 3-hydroxyacyl-CoA dehydrogenase nad-binding protein [Chlorobi bacterium OLB7]MBK8912080.1 3-hydroxybutyryl-CoA dehydrogenase [Chlorobiota bacterium]MBX7217145.1 3-hydroxybutyryl-CoA dehydrogenase [Candidatus Kapabacteria bacterium]
MSNILSGTFGVCGGGTMGSGIAYAAAMAGYSVHLYDITDEAVARGISTIKKFLAGGVERGKITEEIASTTMQRVQGTTSLESFADCGVVVEAIVENMEVKKNLFTQLAAVVHQGCILASNTSSLPITELANGIPNPERVVGMHFFNPAHIMKLVEVIEGFRTSQEVVETTVALSRELGKTPVRAKDTPGFIVNRVARNFYGESFRIAGEGASTHDQIDRCMKAIGFKMGPFELMDLIGIDVNFAVTQSVYDLYFNEARFRPHLIQRKMVESGLLGKKSGKGFY